MAQTIEGAQKIAAQKLNMALADYIARITGGEKWCTLCKAWHKVELFAKDKSRNDGLTASCTTARNAKMRAKYTAKPRPQKGRVYAAKRNNDKKQARARVNYLVNANLLPHPNTLPCSDCGQKWECGKKRHEYDHAKGYAICNHEYVEVVCVVCHKKRTKNQKANFEGEINGK